MYDQGAAPAGIVELSKQIASKNMEQKGSVSNVSDVTNNEGIQMTGIRFNFLTPPTQEE